MDRTYIAIDLKSFYASVECVERGLDPLTTNLVVADPTRTEKTICLAVSPSLKRYGIPGRARLFEVLQKVNQVNADRRVNAPNGKFVGTSTNGPEIDANPGLELGFIQAPPRMHLYMEYSTKVLDVYYKYVAPEDIHVYSIDECFIDVTAYLNTYKMTAHELAIKMIREVLSKTGVTATAGIGTNMYLCKIAMDIVAKKMPADKEGVRIAELDEQRYRELLWGHRPLTDFWRVGRGISKKLEQYGMHTMGDVAMCSLGKPGEYYNEDLLYRLFGINAELLIDHAWGYEPVEIKDIKSYRPEVNSLSTGQVLKEPYPMDKARLIVKEMTDSLALDLVRKGVETDQIVINLGYDTENITDPDKAIKYNGDITMDAYGRAIPKHSHGSINLSEYTSSPEKIMEAALTLFDRIADPELTVRRLNVVAERIITEKSARRKEEEEVSYQQLDLFTDYSKLEQEKEEKKQKKEREKSMQKALLSIKDKYGKNAVLRGMNFEEGATAIERNGQIGGHKA